MRGCFLGSCTKSGRRREKRSHKQGFASGLLCCPKRDDDTRVHLGMGGHRRRVSAVDAESVPLQVSLGLGAHLEPCCILPEEEPARLRCRQAD